MVTMHLLLKEESELQIKCKIIIHNTDIILYNLIKENYEFSFSHYYSIWVNIIPPDGIPRRIAGYKDESLLDAISRH